MSTPTLDTAHTQPKPSSTKRVQGGLLDPKMLWRSLPDALRKLDPRTLWRNPVMFIVEIGAVWSTVLAIADPTWFGWLTVVWLWLTVVFANLAEAVAEGRGKAQAESLRRTKTATMARRLVDWAPGAPGREEQVGAPLLQQGDIVVVEAGQTIRRRRRGGRHCLGGRIGHHGRIGTGHPRIGRRPLGGHGRHHGAVGPHRRQDHAEAR